MTSDHTSPDRLIIGVMLDAPRVPAWTRTLLSEVRACDTLDLTVVILNDSPDADADPWRSHADPHRSHADPYRSHADPHRSHADRWWLRGRGRLSLLFGLYETLDRASFKTDQDAFDLVDASSVLDQVETILAPMQRDGSAIELPDADVEALRSRDLDVILDLSAVGPLRLPPGVARYGVWSVHHGNSVDDADCPVYFWEIHDRRCVSGIAIRASLAERDDDATIGRSCAAIDHSSLHRTRNAMAWRVPNLVMRCLRTLQTHGPDGLTMLRADQTESTPRADQIESTTAGNPRGMPGNRAMMGFLARQFGRFLYNRYVTHLLSYRWVLAIRPRRELKGDTFDPTGFEVIDPPKGRFWADPFLLKVGADTHVFFEDVAYSVGKGVISHFAIGPDGRRTTPTVVLERDYHLSYPFVFEWNGEHYMIPETARNRQIELYRAVEFPVRWELDRVLIRGHHAVDSTLFEHAGVFWLFANLRTPGGTSDHELFCYHAETPLGPWTPHPMNPIVPDARHARPAGRIFPRGDQIIRPSQDASQRYGGAVVLNRVDVLTETAYRETPIARIEPNWHPEFVGTHTYNRSEDFEIVDGYSMTWRFRR